MFMHEHNVTCSTEKRFSAASTGKLDSDLGMNSHMAIKLVQIATHSELPGGRQVYIARDCGCGVSVTV